MTDIDALIAELRAGLDAEMDWRKSQTDLEQLARFIHAASPQNIRALLDHIERQANALAMWDQVREGVAHVIGENAEWQINGNAPLAVMASYMLRVCERNKAEAELARLRAPVSEGEVCEVIDNLMDETSRLDQRAYSDRCVSPDCAMKSKDHSNADH